MMLSRYISEEELENIRNDKEQRNEAYKGYIKLVDRELEKIEQEKATMMNSRTRQRKLDIGIAYIAEAILDILQEAKQSKQGPVSTDAINKELKIEAEWERPLSKSVLDYLVHNGEVVNPGARTWQLAD